MPRVARAAAAAAALVALCVGPAAVQAACVDVRGNVVAWTLILKTPDGDNYLYTDATVTQGAVGQRLGPSESSSCGCLFASNGRAFAAPCELCDASGDQGRPEAFLALPWCLPCVQGVGACSQARRGPRTQA